MQDVLLRTALWEVHSHLCVYCGQVMSFSEMQADHIIPAILKSDVVERTRVLKGLGLSSTADLDGLWNRVPSHRRCNRLKSDDLLNDSNARFFLEIAAKIEPKVTMKATRLRDRAREDRIKAAVAIAVASGQASVNDLVRAAVEAGSGPALIARMQVGDSPSSLVQSVAAGVPISELLELPILPRKHGLEVLTMVKDEDRATVVNCADWAKHRRAGYFTVTTYHIKEEVFFQTAYATLRALEIAAPSATSFIRSTKLTLEAASILPASLPYWSPDAKRLVDDWVARKVSLQQLSRTAGVILEESERGLTITWEGMTAYVSEILRADLDGDGVEDILYSYYSRVHQGTFGAGHVGVMTRRSNEALLEEIVVPAMVP
jgi:hypothetical protein